MFNQNIAISQIFETGKIICWAAKWTDSKQIEWRRHGNKDFLTKLHELLSEADVLLTYNGRRFDLPLINREFIKAGLPATAPYKHLDLLETVKRQFKFPSNKLDHVCSELEVGKKVGHEGFGLWTKCREEDPKAWAMMQKYSIGDVTILEKLYLKIKSWIPNHPNEALYTKNTDGVHHCTTCNSTHLQKRGFHVTNVGRYQRYFCTDCQSWSRARTTDIPLEERKLLLSPL